MRTAWLWNSSIMLQLNYEVALLWKSTVVRWPLSEMTLVQGSSLARQLCFSLHCHARLHSACLPLLCSNLPCPAMFNLPPVRLDRFNISAPARKTQSSVFSKMGKYAPASQRGADLHGKKPLPLVPDWSSICK